MSVISKARHMANAGGVTVLDVEEGNTVLETALDNGLELSHDCKMGVRVTRCLLASVLPPKS